MDTLNNNSTASQSPPKKNRPNLTVQTYNPKNAEIDERWLEFKINGKNIPPRSHHISAVYENYFYVHGGYDVEKGALDDFYRLDLSSEKDGFEWEVLVPFEASKRVPNYPPKLRSHSSVVYNNQLIIFGGEIKLNESNRNVYVYDFDQKTWSKHQPNLASLPALNSQSSTLHGDVMYVFGGYIISKGVYSNQLYSLDLKNFKWLHIDVDGAHKKPTARSSAGIVVHQGSIWLFGGTNGEVTSDELWKFDLAAKKWQLIPKTDKTPEVNTNISCKTICSLEVISQ